MRRIAAAIATAFLTLGVMVSTAMADAPQPTTFVVVLNAESEVPQCGPATNAARGLAIFHVTNETTGTVRFKLVANNLPGNPVAAHIHIAPSGVAGPVVQGLGVSGENGVVQEGSFTNPALLAAIRATPQNYYVNVHSNVCPPGVIRGQFGDRGP